MTEDTPAFVSLATSMSTRYFMRRPLYNSRSRGARGEAARDEPVTHAPARERLGRLAFKVERSGVARSRVDERVHHGAILGVGRAAKLRPVRGPGDRRAAEPAVAQIERRAELHEQPHRVEAAAPGRPVQRRAALGVLAREIEADAGHRTDGIGETVARRL